jgi:hypothetical protein
VVSTVKVNGKSIAYETDQYGTSICVMKYEHYGEFGGGAEDDTNRGGCDGADGIVAILYQIS